jgi:myosin-1
LGNFRLQGRDAPAQGAPGTEESLRLAAYLFGVESSNLLQSITHKTVAMGGKRGSVVQIPQNSDQATQIRDALAKEMYSRLFDFVIGKLNQAMAIKGATPVSTMSILDIYGFEIFANNVFEQLCINFVNERIVSFWIAPSDRSRSR